MRRLSRLIIGFSGLFMLSPICLAELSFGIGVGYVSSEETTRADVAEILYGMRSNNLNHFTQDNTDVAFRLLASHDVLDRLDIEFAYTDYGKNSFSGDYSFPPASNVTRDYAAASASGKLTGLSFSVAPKKQYPNGVAVNAKIGALVWDVEGEGNYLHEINFDDSTTYRFEEAPDLDDDGVDLIIGVGASYGYFTIGYERVSIS